MDELVTGYGLIEGPTWDAARGLIFSDVLNGGVFGLSKDHEVSTLIPHRRGIGGIVLHQSGGLVVGGRNICYKSLDGENSVVLLDSDITSEALGFNDFTTDSKGRIYVGSLAFKVFDGGEARPGHLHVIDLDGAARTLSDGSMLTNGMGFSPDGGLLYHADARENIVRVYHVYGDGEVSPWRPFARIGNGHPDGLAIAEDGSVWIAIAHGARVDVFEPTGELRKSLPVPLPMVTSLCFGGDDLHDLYVVTGSRGGPKTNCGTIYKVRTDIAGLPVSEARISLNL